LPVYACPTTAAPAGHAVIARAAPMRIDRALVAVPLALSATRTVKANCPAVLAIPAMRPFALKLRPGGKAPPVTLQLYGGWPPLADSVCPYCTPEIPSGSETVPTDNGEVAALTAIEQFWVAEPEPLSDTRTVKADVPAAVGVPEICPRCPSSASPVGSWPVVIDQLYGDVPPAAASDAL